MLKTKQATPRETVGLARMRQMLESARRFDRIGAQVRALVRALRQNGYDDEDVSAMMPLAQQFVSPVLVANALLVEWLDHRKLRRNHVLSAALAAGMFDNTTGTPDSIARSFRRRLERTRNALRKSGMAIEDVVYPAYQSARFNEHVRTLVADFAVARRFSRRLTFDEYYSSRMRASEGVN